MTSDARTEWRNAWPIPFAGAICYAIASIYFYSMGMFIAPIEKELGWSRAQISSAFVILSAVGVFANPLMGRVLDRYGSRRVALFGMSVHCAAFSAMSLVESLWMWWFLWGLAAVGGAAVSAMVWVAATVSRFDKARGLALAITLCGAGIGASAAPLLASGFIADYGWRGAYARLGAGMAAVALPLILLLFYDACDLRRRSGEPVHAPAQRALVGGSSYLEALWSMQFIKLALSTLLLSVPMFAISANLIPILASLGIDNVVAASAAAAFGMGSLAGRAGTGLLLDRVNPTILGAVIFALPIAGLVLLMSGAAIAPAVIIGAATLGLALGGEIDIVAYLTSRYMAETEFASLFGIIVTMQILALGIGPFAVNYGFDLTGSYSSFLVAALPCFALASMMILSLGKPRITVGQPAEAA